MTRPVSRSAIPVLTRFLVIPLFFVACTVSIASAGVGDHKKMNFRNCTDQRFEVFAYNGDDGSYVAEHDLADVAKLDRDGEKTVKAHGNDKRRIKIKIDSHDLIRSDKALVAKINGKHVYSVLFISEGRSCPWSEAETHVLEHGEGGPDYGIKMCMYDSNHPPDCPDNLPY